MSRVNNQVEKNNFDIVVLETIAEDFGWEVKGIEWDCATIGNYEGQRRSFKNPRIAAKCLCDTPSDMPHCLINIGHIGDIGLKPT